MSKFVLAESFIYRHRLFLGYGLFVVGLLATLIFAGLYFPGGISNDEMKSVVISSNINILNVRSVAIVNLPYHIFQNISLNLFGVSMLSIKLPSIILAFLSAIGVVLLLRRWFKPSIGVLASLISISTSQFMFLAQDGTPSIMYIFWAVWLLLLASSIIRNQKYRIVYIVAFYVTAAACLYTPLSVYALIALVASIILHPHLRYLIRKMPKFKVAVGIFCAILLISPLIVFIVYYPKLGFELLGIPPSWPNILNNFKTLGTQYLGFANPGGSTLMTPFFELGSMMIAGIGIIQVYKNRFTSKNYLIILWSACIVPIIIINPIFTSVTYIPIVLLLASGLSMLLSHWYELFPRNPYARFGGFVPLAVLVLILVFSGVDRHVYGYNYDPNIAQSFSRDVTFATSGHKNIVVAKNELSFYKAIEKYNSNIQVSDVPVTEYFWATRQAKNQFAGYAIEQIVTSGKTIDGDRFYLYKKTDK